MTRLPGLLLTAASIFGCTAKAALDGTDSPTVDSEPDSDSATHHSDSAPDSHESDSHADSPPDSDSAHDSEDTDPPDPVEAAYTTTWGQDMIEVSAGTFLMGSGRGDPDPESQVDHEVTLTHTFYLSRSEVTQAQWALFGGAWELYPSSGAFCPECPVDGPSWEDAALYANALSTAEGLAACYLADGSDVAAAYLDADGAPSLLFDCPGYRLPTEAEWEYAARAGEDTEFSGSDIAEDVAWYERNSEARSHDVCTLAPDAWGFCDMSGNAWEWVNDRACFSCDGFDGTPVQDPVGSADAYDRVLRGGTWEATEVDLRVGWRFAAYSDYLRFVTQGFRLARTAP